MHSFAGQMADMEAAIRHARQPMLALERQDANYKQWATVVVRAEIKHATDDFWRCMHAHGADLLFDHYKRDQEARPFRFRHEVHAVEAWDWLGALNTHEGWKRAPWALWMHWNERQRADWRVRWFSLARGFVRRMQAYRAARGAHRRHGRPN